MGASDYSVDRREALRYMGHRGQEIDPELMERIDRLCDLCLSVSAPVYRYTVYKVEPGPTIGGVRLMGSDIARHLEGAVYCAVMAATLGFGPEREIARLARRSTADEVIFNGACTALVESAADRCEAEIVEKAESMGLVTSYRYSPGYGDFPLEQQGDILRLCEAGPRLGITLTDSLLMLPRKSVSALVGMYPADADIRRGGSSCRTCENYENCDYRKEGLACGG